ncbi:histidine phosphatase family protein [Aeromonas rivipollensis]|uniref:histidine phosphatase family protein n=1 Tax=Aeromonas rivipollensis TaxID=948519 RepID=UPI0027D93991|nr:histidine phosphatase family protein [uncultured Aeromonas sp.]MDU1145049.1 histidine phosphatase family protein [Aeromonas hydrophila]
MELVVIRHGETRTNAEGRYLGALDMGLNETGWAQVGTLAQALSKGAQFQRLLTSPLLRARQSADLISGELALPARIVPAFRERHVGVFEGLTQAEARVRYPELWARNITRRWAEGPPGGESLDAVIARVSSGLSVLADEAQDERVLLVAHGVVAKVIRAVTTNGFADFFEWQLHNGGRLVVDIPQAQSPIRFHRPAGQD